MACRARTSAETERIREREEALSATETTRQLDELLRLSKGSTRAPADNFWELKMNVATFMSLVWVLFGSECDYYKGLRNVYATLELKEVMAQKHSFTPEHCRRITWAILDDGRAHFDDVKTTFDFRGQDEPAWPQSYLIDILRNVRYAIPVERANFPEEWKRKIRTIGTEQQGGQLGGTLLPNTTKGQERTLMPGRSNHTAALQQPQGYGTGRDQAALQGGNAGQWWPNPYMTGQYQGPVFPGGGFTYPTQPQSRDWHSGWKDERHPKIKAVMQGYLTQTNGRVHVAEILAAAGRRQTDLPTLPKYVHASGRPFLCWTSVLGRCTYRDCRFRKEGGHPLPADITDAFADQVIDIIGKGLIKPIVSARIGPPPKKQKVGDGPNPQN